MTQPPAFPFTISAPESDDVETLTAFNVALAAESEGTRLIPATVAAGVQAVLDDPQKGRYFVARIGDDPENPGEVVGQVLVTVEWSDWRNGPIWWVQSVYVCPEHRRQGIFRGLFKHVLTQAKAAAVPTVRLYVERENTAARATYTSFGMTEPGYLVMEKML